MEWEMLSYPGGRGGATGPQVTRRGQEAGGTKKHIRQHSHSAKGWHTPSPSPSGFLPRPPRPAHPSPTRRVCVAAKPVVIARCRRGNGLACSLQEDVIRQMLVHAFVPNLCHLQRRMRGAA